MADDLHYRTVNIRRADRSIFLQVVNGFDQEPDFRGGEDDIIVYAAGRRARARWIDRRPIELQGWVMGLGVDLAAQRIAYRQRVDELHAILDPSLPAGPLVAAAPYLGIASGTATIQARYLNAVWDEVVLGRFRRVSVELECVTSPPDWAFAP